jgi:ADP-ribose pyrophosphatase YjhB (NUDIX family)
MKKKIIPAVLGLAVNKDRKFLLTQRYQPRTPSVHLKWNVPGGAIEWGETPTEALIREFQEELDVVPRFLFPHPTIYNGLWYGKDTGSDTDAHILLLVYLVDIGDQEIDLTYDPEEETCDYRWYSLDDLDDLETLPNTKEGIEEALNLLDQYEIM